MTPSEMVNAFDELRRATDDVRTQLAAVASEMKQWRFSTGTYTPMSECPSYPKLQNAEAYRRSLRRIYGV